MSVVDRGESGARALSTEALFGSRLRKRSFGLLERQRASWSVLLVTYADADGTWRGYFEFESGQEVPGDGVLRSAALFIESSEADVDARARGLGRPLLQALLESALHTRERRSGFSPDLRRWFRELLAKHSAQREPSPPGGAADLSLAHLGSLYDAYRLDQVAHLIALLAPEDFAALVDRLLAGRRIDFRARDRFQLAMAVVQDLERRLMLPPFEVWVEDFLAHPEEYARYTHRLHREGELGLP